MEKTYELPFKLQAAAESLVLIAREEGYLLIALLARAEPASVAVLASTNESPADLFRAAAELVDDHVGNVIRQVVRPVN